MTEIFPTPICVRCGKHTKKAFSAFYCHCENLSTKFFYDKTKQIFCNLCYYPKIDGYYYNDKYRIVGMCSNPCCDHYHTYRSNKEEFIIFYKSTRSFNYNHKTDKAGIYLDSGNRYYTIKSDFLKNHIRTIFQNFLETKD